METVNQENGTAQEQAKTFTQEEVNAIVAERVGRANAQYKDYEDLKAKAAKYDEAEEAAKSELQKATERADRLQAENDSLRKADEIRTIRDKVSRETGVPVNLLSGETEEDCKTQAAALLEFRGDTQKYPSVKDGGEPQHTETKKTDVEQFEDWFNSSI